MPTTTGSTRVVGRQTARDLVEGICKQHGYIPQRIYDMMPEEARQVVAQVIDLKDTRLASQIVTLARNLYTSRARFVFELLQNAEDNDFADALDRNEAPYVAFHVYRDKIVQICNEDGFTAENLAAICDVGKTSKTGAQGYIGEKGIGFKSVFMAAYSVHIMSGDLSFYFKHRNSDSGMGMIQPIWEDNEDTLDGATRITLLLHDDDTEEEQEKQRNLIRKQFEEIQDTVLLFMCKLEKIEIFFHDNENNRNEVTKSICYKIDRKDEKRVKVTKTSSLKALEETYYHTIKHVATNLTKNENRKYSAEEEASRAYARGEVVLAFPISLSGTPILDNQWIFAFLPVKQMGFKFLIQADFVTQANRQDIVTSSARNEGLADAIAEAFVKAVKQMCSKAPLLYQWMRYLPQDSDNFPWDGYWSAVIDKIKEKLESTPVLQVIQGTHLMLSQHPPLELIKESRQNSANNLDKNNQPLFADINPRRYLSLMYKSNDLNMLHEYGLELMYMDEIVHRVASDLEQPLSRLRITTDSDWQARAARLLHRPWKRDWASRQKEILALSLIPLADGRWVAAANTQVYFPKVHELDLALPLDLIDYSVISPAATMDSDRKMLFESLGAKTASVAPIRQAIIDKYRHTIKPFNVQKVAYHLQFLYLTSDTTESIGIYDAIRILHFEGRTCYPKSTPMYLSDTDNAYGVSLLTSTPAGDSPGAGAPGLSVLIMNDIYFKDLPNPPKELKWSFKEWLHRMFYIRRHLPLVDEAGKELSEICHYVAEHRPEKFMGFLQATWTAEKSRFHDTKSIADKLDQIEVLTERGTAHGTEMRRLCEAYLPLEDLEEICSRYLGKDTYFPFLKLEQPLSHGTHPQEWEALARDSTTGLGLNHRPDQLVLFLFDILDHAALSDTNDLAAEPASVYCDIYTHLQLKVCESSDKAMSQGIVRKGIEADEVGAIFIPQHDDPMAAGWTRPENCVWEAPDGLELRYKNGLKSLYSKSYPDFETNQSLLTDFFLKTLQIRHQCTWQDLVEEVREFKRSSCTDFDRIHDIYLCLHKMKLTGTPKEEMKNTFTNEDLVYGDTSDGVPLWYKASDCLWSSATKFRGMFVVNQIYQLDLHSFFTKGLGVKTVTVRMVYDKLADKDAPELPIEEIKDTLVQFSSLLESEGCGDDDGMLDRQAILRNRVFPVRVPNENNVQLWDAQVKEGETLKFAISDRKPLVEAFSRKAAFLDFDMSTVQSLETFIRWAGLTGGYLSHAVKEIPSVDVASARLLSLPHCSISTKAYALVCIASFFNASQARTRTDKENLYRLLRNSQTLETDKITLELRLMQGRHPPLKADKEVGMLHLRQDSQQGLFEIYVPRDVVQQDVCFRSKLPHRLCEWLMEEPGSQICEPMPTKAITVVQSVLTARSASVSAILDEHGIPEIDSLERPNEAAEEVTASASSRSATLSVPPWTAGDEPSRSATLSVPPWTAGDEPYPTTETPENGSNLELRTPSSSVVSPAPSIPSELSGDSQIGNGELLTHDRAYASLVRRVVHMARAATFPARGTGAFDMSTLQAALDDNDRVGSETPYSPSYCNKWERDRRIGAAGELFVFELLSRLNPALSDFSRANWQSTIRYRISENHPDYADMAPWKGHETSDIVYHDTNGVFTNLLVENGYLCPDTWAGVEDVEYFIEVKTSTKHCQSPFYMSKKQFNMMQSPTNRGLSQEEKKMYIIMRVYNLGSTSMGMRILIDPEGIRQAGQLEFTTDTWSVVMNNEVAA